MIEFVSGYYLPYLWLLGTTFLNVIAPISGSVITNPVMAYFTDPQRAIGIGAAVAFFGGIHRIYLFRKEILDDARNIKIVKQMLPYSIAGAMAGGLLISSLNVQLLALIVVVVSVHFIYKTARQIISTEKKEESKSRLGYVMIAMLTGFFQGSGMPGADIRNNYLRTVLSEVSVRATGTILGATNFLVAGTVIFLHNKMRSDDIIFVVSLIPFLFIAQIYGKRFLEKIPDRIAKIIALCLSLLGVILLVQKYLM
jgi:uncharacterized membrane protein YfcA